MTDHEPKHPPADMAGLDGLIERLRKARVWPDYSQSRVTIETAHEAATQLQALAARVKVLEAENERLRDALTLAANRLARKADNRPWRI